MIQNKSYEAINAGIMGKITKSTKPTIIINENAGIVVKIFEDQPLKQTFEKLWYPESKFNTTWDKEEDVKRAGSNNKSYGLYQEWAEVYFSPL